jgi:hypothetical protein
VRCSVAARAWRVPNVMDWRDGMKGVHLPRRCAVSLGVMERPSAR